METWGVDSGVHLEILLLPPSCALLFSCGWGGGWVQTLIHAFICNACSFSGGCPERMSATARAKGEEGATS